MVTESNNNIELNNQIQDGKWMVCYYAEWCGYCQQMSDDWEQLENKIKENKLQVNVIKIEQKNITNKDIKGFPTIIYYNNGISEPYNGERTTSALYTFLKNKVICSHCGKMKQ